MALDSNRSHFGPLLWGQVTISLATCWEIVADARGYGALFGGVAGLTLGFVDLADDHPGMGNLILRDALYGATFGGVTASPVSVAPPARFW